MLYNAVFDSLLFLVVVFMFGFLMVEMRIRHNFEYKRVRSQMWLFLGASLVSYLLMMLLIYFVKDISDQKSVTLDVYFEFCWQIMNEK